MKDNTVGVIHYPKCTNYNIDPPFNPPQKYPEFLESNHLIDVNNKIYDMVRELFLILNLDKENIGNNTWNPLSEIIDPGNTVIIKPNFVKHYHSSHTMEGVISQITNGAILRPIIDYSLLALNGKGRLIIADTPLDKANFNKILRITKTKQVVDYINSISSIRVELYDLRTYKRKTNEEGIFLLQEEKLPGAPGGYKKVNLRRKSEFHGLDQQEQNYYTLADFKVDRYNPKSRRISNTNRYHYQDNHIYQIPSLILEADTIISVPKLKTHKKAGVTLGLKNMVGICEKLFMPHYRPGTPPNGDAHSFEPNLREIYGRKARTKTARFLKKSQIGKFRIFQFILWKTVALIFGRAIPERNDWWGDWHGNDTLWRTILDLNKIVRFCSKNGELMDEKQRNHFCIIDGIIGQEGKGPMSGNPKPTGLIVGGFNPVSCDAYTAHIMGFNIEKISQISKVIKIDSYNFGEVDLNNLLILSNFEDPLSLNLNFKPPLGYKGVTRDNSFPTHEEYPKNNEIDRVTIIR